MHSTNWVTKQLAAGFQHISLANALTSFFSPDQILLLGLAAGLDEGDALLVLGGAARGAAHLEGLDDTDGLGVGNLAEDDVAAIEPRGDDSGDEELGAVAVAESQQRVLWDRVGIRWDCRTYVLGPALAMERRKGLLWVSLKFSSLNFSP